MGELIYYRVEKDRVAGFILEQIKEIRNDSILCY